MTSAIPVKESIKTMFNKKLPVSAMTHATYPISETIANIETDVKKYFIKTHLVKFLKIIIVSLTSVVGSC
jgi:hypothetical protein